MSQELSQTLLKERVVASTQLDEALERQVVFGGSLDTNLLESGTVSEQDLLHALSLTFKAPPAAKANIDQIGAHIPRLFPLVFAETYHMVPYRLVEEDLWVLVNGAPDEQLLARIHERLRLRVMPAVTTEVRLHYAMHRLYGTTLLPRFSNLIQKLDGELPKAPEGVGAREHVLSWGMQSAPIAPTRARGDKKRATIDLRALLARLDAATDRDSIVEILLSATIGIFDFAGLFLVQGDTVNGWRGTTPDATGKIVRVSLKVELPSVFQTIYATQGHYLGPLPQNSINAKLLADMGRTPPRAALVAPITVGGKLAAMLYADNGAAGVPPKRVAAVLMLAQRAGMCLETLLRRRKQLAAQQASAAPTPTPPAASGDGWMVQSRRVELVAEEPAAAARALPVDASAIAEASQDEVIVGADAEQHHIEPVANAAFLETPEVTEIHEVEEVEEVEAEVVGDQGYEAFADVKDSEALDDWEDVLLEAASSATEDKGVERKKHAPPSVTWEDVIAEAERSATLLSAPQSIEVAGQVVDEKDLLFDGLEAQDPETRRNAIQRLAALGSSIDNDLRDRFPGPLSFDPLAPDVRLPPFRRVNGFCELLATRGDSAAGIVLAHLESEDARRRFFAIYFLHAVHYPPALGGLARRLYDTEPRNRYLAADALRTYGKEAGYTHIVQGLRDQLKVPILETQVTTIEVLGQLREPSAVPSLIPLVMAPRPEVQSAAASALAVICAQAFGPDVTRWAQWWQSHFNRPRGAWLVEGLRHPHPAIVRIAHGELMLLSGRSIPFDLDGPQDQREQVIRAWEAWWAQASQAPAVATKNVLAPA